MFFVLAVLSPQRIDNLAPKTHTPQNTINIGFSTNPKTQIQLMAMKQPFLDEESQTWNSSNYLLFFFSFN